VLRLPRREQFLPQCGSEERERELRSLEQHARDWPPDLLEGLRDDEFDDLVVVTHLYKPTPAAVPVAELLGLLPETE
jgi:hypothetical protein